MQSLSVSARCAACRYQPEGRQADVSIIYDHLIAMNASPPYVLNRTKGRVSKETPLLRRQELPEIWQEKEGHLDRYGIIYESDL